MDIKKIVRKNVMSLTAYQAKEVPCKVKLDANESPYGFPEMYKTLKYLKTNRYPDPEAAALRKAVAKGFGVKPENILQGNGSDELIYYLVTTFGGPVLYPTPTFSMYGIISQALGEKRVEVSLDNDFDLAVGPMLTALRQERPKVIFLSSPNNPTGNCFSSDRILKVLEAASSKAIVVVDEAYQPFASERGFIPLLRDYEHLVIMRTLSKIGLAALRIGFLVGREEIVNEVNKVRLPFNVNALSQTVALSAIEKKGLMSQYVKSVVSERKRLFKELSGIKSIVVYPSEANFILFRVRNSDRVFEALLGRGVLVRNMKGAMEGCLRVTVGTPDENRIFLKALSKAVIEAE